MLRILFRRLPAAALLFSGAAAAHDFHMGIADISFNTQTGNTEIVHTYTAHDVEALLGNLYQRSFDLSSEDDERVFRRYVERQFYLTSADGQRLQLLWMGLRVDADSIVVYQEIEHVRLSPGARIHDALLIDFLPQQTNTVNVQVNAATTTLMFGEGHLDQQVQ